MTNLNSPIENLYSVGPKNLKRFNNLGIKTIKDLVFHFPHRYDDYSKVIPIDDINEAGQTVTITGRIADMELARSWRRRMTIINATVRDESGFIRVVWFNQHYIADMLKPGTAVSLSGKVSLDKKGLYLSSPAYERISESDIIKINDRDSKIDIQLAHTGRLVPVYHETEGITSKYIRFLLKPIIPSIKNIPDPLPQQFLEKHNLPEINQALKAVHFPNNLEDAEKAVKRFAIEELLLFQLRSMLDKQKMKLMPAPKIKFDEKLTAKFVKSLPFKLTKDQKISAYEILKDLENPHPMNRLLNGDVGSGKTVVALMAAYQTASAKYQTVFMAPTEVLAKQHFNSLKTLLNDSEIKKSKLKIGLLTGSEAKQFPVDETEEEKIKKPLLKKKIENGEIDIIIGTHAVIQKDVKFKKLGLVIVDEQHRFGIKQRMQLVKNKKIVPHFLSMTATPIPRTLTLTIYGDLDISLIKEKPANRKPIKTRVIPHSKRQDAYNFIKKQITEGRQAFVICPRITSSNTDKEQTSAQTMWADVKAVEEEYEKLSKKIFPDLKIAMLHGKMPAIKKRKTVDEGKLSKEEIMNKFKKREYDILVSTSVIEVGVDIPNATIMMIESAERFGLAQLHQFRGRVGRGEHQSYCLLFTTDDTKTTGRRLKALEATDDGFKLSEMDLKIRGPGELTGINQSGMPDFAMTSFTDTKLIKTMRDEAKLILNKDPELTNYPLLMNRLKEIQKVIHFE
ncbi:MAG: ATP-dependent DNA helicase RecG [Candidatus Yanofskybacteria bacterium CG10_big_fil_rev_8_21_14_0_10_36_16]|uniref:ATP-dependent DNA helicase RecG n=1 Tax=Candidatus Yanofskybacteria bacterium CG10_big_fil_rev_8_21_14_0_10_36_16 TaxID=1975096 RepID=A0A2J0Q772_9BACT|nr:MAG: ATP-dependent DNA helicase RecG [Candidatus Yanofskybacteria bacterium CG10_big_fil_rev_8_21_14_0_10_36_16]